MRTYSRKKVEYQVIEGVKELCRLCLAKCDDFIPIFTEESDVCAALPMRIMICVGLEMVREDSLPNIICQNCYRALEKYYTFRKKCEVTYQKLKAHMLAVKEQESNKQKTESKQNMKNPTIEQNVELRIPNGDVEGQLVLALNDNEQLELVNVVGLNGVIQVHQKQDDQSSGDLLQQSLENEMQDQVTLSRNQDLQQSIENQIQNQVSLSSNQMLQQHMDNEIQMQDISTTSQTQHNHIPDSIDMSQLLPSILIRLGIVSEDRGVFQLMDRDFREVELEGGRGETVVLELFEEDEEGVEDTSEMSIQPTIAEATSPETEEGSGLVVEPLAINEVRPPLTIPPKGRKPRKKSAKGDQVVINAVSASARARCSVCDKTLSSRSALARHARAHASPRARAHACRTCGRAFAQRAVLLRHELVHQENRPFKCPQCPKSFTQRSALESHTRSHAPPHARPLSLHLCGSCPKVFLYPSGLSRHMSVHEGRVYTCDDCGRHFRDKSALQRHLRSATHRRAQAQGAEAAAAGAGGDGS
ncbi:zinc finger protein 853-like [Plodia interpunctella]|uniref:zinc finger protein 853-like n=1 Tax=Plodia interpunctella TaxID=58824 RepID=UPI002368DDC4|nr:zinc finger protein 853-like [Plodia interpunctella]XP_053603905.1 zinc finger protein 853-like [Plodia interpunctella]